MSRHAAERDPIDTPVWRPLALLGLIGAAVPAALIVHAVQADATGRTVAPARPPVSVPDAWPGMEPVLAECEHQNTVRGEDGKTYCADCRAQLYL
ncbi:hypothetical protein [Streptomyces boncukensis]|uniref:Uncharacterized protein n=1 Tax=Streptomyces boncukensis TaxID=2711219 RepID=A0A6G4X019_9ACTN|nr:hypothetical protein [Streptomyces boncukensis]NGO70011.1 hypothetical protein [Streptomyces boncukensis]